MPVVTVDISVVQFIEVKTFAEVNFDNNSVHPSASEVLDAPEDRYPVLAVVDYTRGNYIIPESEDDTPNVIGDPSTGEVIGDPSTGEVWGF